jgi:hypothetical protein
MAFSILSWVAFIKSNEATARQTMAPERRKPLGQATLAENFTRKRLNPDGRLLERKGGRK